MILSRFSLFSFSLSSRCPSFSRSFSSFSLQLLPLRLFLLLL